MREDRREGKRTLEDGGGIDLNLPITIQGMSRSGASPENLYDVFALRLAYSSSQFFIIVLPSGVSTLSGWNCIPCMS